MKTDGQNIRLHSLNDLGRLLGDRMPNIPRPRGPCEPQQATGAAYETAVCFPDTGWSRFRPVQNGRPFAVPARATMMVVRLVDAKVPPLPADWTA